MRRTGVSILSCAVACAACAGRSELPTAPLIDGSAITADRTVSAVDGGSACTFPPGSRQGKLVRLVLLSPSDRPARPGLIASMEVALRHAQLWFSQHTPLGQTFALHDPPVENGVTTHDASWYASHDAGGEAKGWFWQNVLADGFELTSAQYGDPNNLWIFYIDADADCGQQDNGVLNGVALVPANDLRGLMNEQRLSSCPDATPGREQRRCRWVGGMAWMIGGAAGLQRPAACAETPCPEQDLMSAGYELYPQTALADENGALANDSAFFGDQELPDCELDCSLLP